MTSRLGRLKRRRAYLARQEEAVRALAWSALIGDALSDNEPSFLERLVARIRRRLGRG